MNLKIKATSLLMFLLTLFYFFPIVYTTKITNLVKYILVIIAAIYLIINKRKFAKPNKLLILCLIYNLYILLISLFRGLDYANLENLISIMFLCIYLVYVEDAIVYDEKTTINVLYYLFSVLIIWDLLIVIIYPNGISGYNSIYGAQFLFGNKNNHTIQIFVYLILSFWKSSFSENHKKRLLALSIFLSSTLAILLNSSTTIVCVVIAVFGLILYYFGIYKPKINAKAVFFICIVLNFMIIVGQATFLQPLVEKFGKNMTFTNRTLIWDKTIIYILQKPILGWGYIDTNTKYKLFGYINTHNQFLDSTFYGGIIAFSILILSLFLIVSSIDKLESKDGRNTITLLFIALMIKMIFEQIATSHIAWFLFFLLFLYAKICVRKNGSDFHEISKNQILKEYKI